MRYLTALSAFILFSSFDISAEVSFSNTSSEIVKISPAPSSGLEAIYVIENTDGVTMSYQNSQSVTWSRFSKAGAAYAEEIGQVADVALSSDDMGYVATVDGRPHYFWIINYANHELKLNSVSIDDSNDNCQRVTLLVDGHGAQMAYYSINGRSIDLSRDMTLSYNTLEFDADAGTYRQLNKSDIFERINSAIDIDAPYCDTRFTLTGDRFLKAWNREQSVETGDFETGAIAAETSAEQHTREVDNEQRSNESGLGGSAPCEIDFKAVVTDAAEFYEWQLSRTSDFSVIDDRYPQTDFNYTFREQGTTYVRFFAADASGLCQFTSQTYDVAIGESRLLCPNAFTPESSPGVNDEWKVSYKSIISFECHIFNRWGTEMTSFTDPALGWDGKYKGKYVPAGTYYYVIKAKGADGRDYKMSGDINIIKSKDINTQNNEE